MTVAVEIFKKRFLPEVKIFLFILSAFFYPLQGSTNPFTGSNKSAIKKADSFFNNYEYAKAIPIYKRLANKNDEALRKLADCYRIIQNYIEAENYYTQLAAKTPTDPMVYFYYGEVLLYNNKYDEAKKQFALFSQKDTTDKRGNLYIKVCNEIQILFAKPTLYKVYNLEEINSPVSDFCAVLYKNGIVFSSERIRDLITNNRSTWNDNPFTSMVFAKGEKAKDSTIYGKVKIFSEKFNGDGYYGPICFSIDYSEMYFTKADNNRRKDNAISQPKIYYSHYSRKWSKPIVLPFCSDNYAAGHPTLSKDGQYLYFSSNMPGGQGGSDIYVSKREGNSWGIPQNLGPKINSTGDEVFPYISADNTLYFSSTAYNGYGGLDIFSSQQKDNVWQAVENLMPPINSSADDFGIFFKTDNSGFLSSNRVGGKGSDDLYGFNRSGSFTDISGKLLYSSKLEDKVQNVKVFLVTDKGVILQTTFTDSSGSFNFKNLPSDQTYTIKIDENDPSVANSKKIYLADVNNRIVKVIVKNKEGYFVFENLPTDLSKLAPLTEDDSQLATTSIAGNFYAGDDQAPMDHVRVNLINAKGEVVQSTFTNSFGSFVFVNISPDENYTVELDDSDPSLISKTIYFTSKDGKEIVNSKGRKFQYELLASDKNVLSLLTLDDGQLLAEIQGILFGDKEGKSRISNSVVKLADATGHILRSTKTDTLGNFKFVNLSADQNYLIKLNEGDSSLVGKNVFLADKQGQVVGTLKSGERYFHYSVLPHEDQHLTNFSFDDPWLHVAKLQSEYKKDSLLTIIENIYFDYQKSDLLPQAIITINKVVDVMKKNPDISITLFAHTDSRGSNEFNMKLSERRAQAAVRYIVLKGITKNRIVGKGMGETQLLNHCTDGVPCSEEEYARNRRIEFKIKKAE